MSRAVGLTTVLERTVERGLFMTPGQLLSTGHRATAIYRLVEGKDPPKVEEIVFRHNGWNGIPTMVRGYPRTHVPMCIDKAMDSVLAGGPPPVKGKRLWHRGPMMRDPLAEKPVPPPRPPKPPRPPEPKRAEIRESGPYFVSELTCWSCRKVMPVYTWTGHEPWGELPPPDPVPKTVKFSRSNAIGHEYWANVCPSCDSLQGDFFLHLTPSGPFYSLKSNSVSVAMVRQIELCAEDGLPLFAPEDGVCWSCKRQVFEKLDGSTYITACPFCNRSFCD